LVQQQLDLKRGRRDQHISKTNQAFPANNMSNPNKQQPQGAFNAQSWKIWHVAKGPKPEQRHITKPRSRTFHHPNPSFYWSCHKIIIIIIIIIISQAQKQLKRWSHETLYIIIVIQDDNSYGKIIFLLPCIF